MTDIRELQRIRCISSTMVELGLNPDDLDLSDWVQRKKLLEHPALTSPILAKLLLQLIEFATDAELESFAQELRRTGILRRKGGA